MAAPETRAEAARDVAALLGGEELIVFLRSPEVGAMLPAPGFPQMLPNGTVWRAFLDECVRAGEKRGELPLQSGGELVPAAGWAEGQDVLFVLLGTRTPAVDVAWFRALLPLFEAIFRGEQRAVAAAIQARLALETANIALHAAEAVAEQASRAKSEFLATMSHELRTPLNAIGGHVQLLSMGLHGRVNEEQTQALGRIDRSARHLLGLINDILNLSRIEAGRVEYEMAEVPLNEALADLAPMIEPQLSAKSLEFEVRNADRLPVVCADREKLQQIMLNLLSNAVKFTEPGGRVWINATRRDGVPGKVFVRVSDTGLGVPNDKIEAIFEPFTQVDASHRRVEQGTGLGLSISRHLARGMGGDLRARSQLGAGSVFTLTLEEVDGSR